MDFDSLVLKVMSRRPIELEFSELHFIEVVNPFPSRMDCKVSVKV